MIADFANTLPAYAVRKAVEEFNHYPLVRCPVTDRRAIFSHVFTAERAAMIEFTEEELAAEEWRAIPDHESYEASNIGRVRSLDRFIFINGVKTNRKGIILAQIHRRDRALQVRVCGTSFLSHRLVALAFIPNPSNLPIINHLDGNRKNNRIENLEWCDQFRNAQHAYDIGLKEKMFGTDNGRATLTEDDVRKIRASLGIVKQIELAEQFGVHQGNISAIQLRKTWAQVL